MRLALPLAVAAVACGGDSVQQGPPLTDTGWFTDTVTITDPANCTARLTTTSPEDGVTGWYWRDRPEVFVAASDPSAYDAFLQTEDGVRLDTELLWDETGLSFTLDWDGWLEAETTYILGVTDCAALHTSTFTTSSLGAPLTVDPASLEGNTYLLDLVGADWVEPPQLAGLLALYFTTPVLLSVEAVFLDTDQHELLGAPGKVDAFGVVTQDTSAPSWDFGITDFSESPFLSASDDEIVLVYASGNVSADVPVQQFLFQGTLAPDGSQLQGGVISGFADSRGLATTLLDEDNPGALCDLAFGLGVQCAPCADGQPYCLFLRATDLGGELVTGLDLKDIGG